MDLFSSNSSTIEDWILLQHDHEGNGQKEDDQQATCFEKTTSVKHVLLSPVLQIHGAAATCKPNVPTMTIPMLQTHPANHTTTHHDLKNPYREDISSCLNDPLKISNDVLSNGAPSSPQQLSTSKGNLSFHPKDPIQSNNVHNEFHNNRLKKRTRSMTTKNSQCENCGTRSTPTWRKNPSTGQTLCNKCGLYELRYGMNRPVKEYLKLGRRKRHVATEAEGSSSTSNVSASTSGDELPECECKKMKQDHIISTQSNESNLTETLNHEGQVHHGWSSLNVLKDRLKEASERYPDIIQTLISLIRKHVLTQPQILSQILQTSQISQQPQSSDHGELSAKEDVSFTDMLILEKSNE
ncbi:hypothetical protein C9374_007242 [Naegleria lovaniensis]|uniref:GATA-type domain-containing protein n=1 Tax=Naegleria lovaniensis TaxID=51637 RepID=A0AA88KRZ9_NAELO|nr:uncharacterized protein C9374_007242 [Naegleria lovaniensis]KAG2393711.1 hypothetical protein C9374_007242 [Naegleria lovaniensis]